MEWGLLTSAQGWWVAGGLISLLFAGFAVSGAAIAVHTSKNEDDRIRTSMLDVVALVLIAAGSSFLGVGMVKSTAGESLNELPDGKYVYDVVFMNEARGNSYYIVVRSEPASKDEVPRVQRSVELVEGTHVNVNGVPAHGKLPAAVLRSGELTVVTEKHPPYKWKVYNIKSQEP